MKKLLSILLLASTAFAQYGYWGHYLLEKGYEENINFLQPNRTLTIEMEAIGEEMLGLFPDTLANMSVNPALLAGIRNDQLQIDFANQKPAEPVYNHYYYPCYDYAFNARFLPPYYQAIERQEISPLLRLISAFRHKTLPLNFALSYELTKHTGNYYENYTYGGYRYGWDAFNEQVSDVAVNAPELRSAGEDTKTKLAHMLDLYSAWQISADFSAGLKLSYFYDNIDGDYRSFNRHNSYENDYENYYDNHDSRENMIEQYEITTGINYTKEKTSLGVSGGWIFGEDNQQRTRMDTSWYFDDYQDQQNFDLHYYNDNSSQHNEAWKHDGNTGFLSMNFKNSIQEYNLMVRMEYLKNNTDITNSGRSLDTSFYEYATYYSDYYYRKTISGTDEIQRGTGDIDRTEKTIGVAVNSGDETKNFTIGLIYQEYAKDQQVTENSVRHRSSQQILEFQHITRWQEQDEDLNLIFNSSEKISHFKIPVSFLFQSEKGWRFRTTLTKIIGSREADERILINYKDFYYKDYVTNSEITDHKNELYLGTPEKESIDRIQFRAYVECDFNENIILSVLFNDIFVSRGQEYHYGPNESEVFNVGNWKFGVAFKF